LVDELIKTLSSGDKMDEKWQCKDQLWQKNGNVLFCILLTGNLGIVQYSKAI